MERKERGRWSKELLPACHCPLHLLEAMSRHEPWLWCRDCPPPQLSPQDGVSRLEFRQLCLWAPSSLSEVQASIQALRYHAACRHPHVSLLQTHPLGLRAKLPTSLLPPSDSLHDSHFPWALPIKFSSTGCLPAPPHPCRSSLFSSGKARTRGQVVATRTSALLQQLLCPGQDITWRCNNSDFERGKWHLLV